MGGSFCGGNNDGCYGRTAPLKVRILNGGAAVEYEQPGFAYGDFDRAGKQTRPTNRTRCDVSVSCGCRSMITKLGNQQCFNVVIKLMQPTSQLLAATGSISACS